jgi:hypothetical protein
MIVGLSNENLFSARWRFSIVQHRNATEKLQILMLKAYQFKQSAEDDQMIRQKLQMSNFLIHEIVFHVSWNNAFIDAE